MQRQDLYKIQEKYNLVINEGYFHIPQRIIKEIKDYYIEIYKKFYKSPSDEITEDKYPSKVFYLDFTGTSFDFLNFIKPKPTVLVKFTSEDSFFWDMENGVNTLKTKNRGNIHIQLLKDPVLARNILSSIIEHEVMHFVQFLLHVYKNKKAGTVPDELMGPAAEIHGSSQTKEGILRKRFRHAFRPIEYYPNIVSSVRELHNLFHERFTMIRDWSTFSKWEKPKIKFFKKFLDLVNEVEVEESFTKLFENSVALHIFKDYKKLSPKFYERMLKILYKAFVNEDRNFDPKKIKDELMSIEKD